MPTTDSLFKTNYVHASIYHRIYIYGNTIGSVLTIAEISLATPKCEYSIRFDRFILLIRILKF